MDTNKGVSRRRFRRFMRTAGMPVSAAVSSNLAPVNRAVRAAVTVVYATFSRNKPGQIQIDVLVSVEGDGYSGGNFNFSVDGVPLDSSPEATRNMIVKAVRSRVASDLAVIGKAVNPERIAVQVFGGVLEVDGSTMMA